MFNYKQTNGENKKISFIANIRSILNISFRANIRT